MTFRESPADVVETDARALALRELHRTLLMGSLAGGMGHELLNLLMPVLLRFDVLEVSPTLSADLRNDVAVLRHTMVPLRQLAEGLRLLGEDPFSKQSDATSTNVADWWSHFRGLLSCTLPSTAIIETEFDTACRHLPVPDSVLTHAVLTLVDEGRRRFDAGNRETWRVVTEVIDTTPRLTISLHSMFQVRQQHVTDTADSELTNEVERAGRDALRMLLHEFRTKVFVQHSADAFSAEVIFPSDAQQSHAAAINHVSSTDDVVVSRAETPRFSVLCIDDNVALVDALERRLGMEAGFTALSRVEDFSQSVEAVVTARPSVVLLDVNLPSGADALAILRDIVKRAPKTSVIVFTGQPTDELITRTRSLGARGFISKGVPADRVIAAIYRVLNGDTVIEVDD